MEHREDRYADEPTPAEQQEQVTQIVAKRAAMSAKYKLVFDGSPVAMEVLADIGDRCFFGKSAFKIGQADGLVLAFVEGKRDLFAYMQEMLKKEEEE